MYLHEIAEAEASFTKEQMQAGKHVEYEKKLMDSYLAKLENTGQYANLVIASQQQPTSHSRNHQSQQAHPLQTAPAVQTSTTTILIPQQQQQSQQPSLPQTQTILLPQLQQQLQQLQQHQQPTPASLLSSAATQQQLLQRQHQQQQILQRQQQQQQQQSKRQQQQSIMIDTDSEDDGLDFDPISVSTRGLRDLLDQQVQQAKQLQMQSYLQQLNSNQALTNVLFQQQNRLNHHNLNSTATNGLLGQGSFIEHPDPLPSLASLTNNSQNQQQQAVTWQNLGAWTNFLQRSGYGFENGR